MRTVFLDRDGVINRAPPPGEYVTSWEQIEVLPGVPEALRLLNQAGFRVIVVTNQRSVALGLASEDEVRVIHHRLLAELRAAGGARVDAIYFCPHGDGVCDCRKPGTGLFLQAQADFPDIDFEASIVVGDSERDIKAGRRLGARVIWIGAAGRDGEPAAASLLEAVKRHILAGSGA